MEAETPSEQATKSPSFSHGFLVVTCVSKSSVQPVLSLLIAQDSKKQTLPNIGISFPKMNSVVVKGQAPILVLSVIEQCRKWSLLNYK